MAAATREGAWPAAVMRGGRLRAGGTEAGSRVYLEGGTPSDSPPKVLKSGPWADIKEKLRVAGSSGAYDGLRLVTAGGPIAVDPRLPNGAAIS